MLGGRVYYTDPLMNFKITRVTQRTYIDGFVRALYLLSDAPRAPMVRHLRAIAFSKLQNAFSETTASVTVGGHYSQRTARAAHSELCKRETRETKRRTLLAPAVIAGPLFLLALRLLRRGDLRRRVLLLLLGRHGWLLGAGGCRL